MATVGEARASCLLELCAVSVTAHDSAGRCQPSRLVTSGDSVSQFDGEAAETWSQLAAELYLQSSWAPSRASFLRQCNPPAMLMMYSHPHFEGQTGVGCLPSLSSSYKLEALLCSATSACPIHQSYETTGPSSPFAFCLVATGVHPWLYRSGADVIYQ